MSLQSSATHAGNVAQDASSFQSFLLSRAENASHMRNLRNNLLERPTAEEKLAQITRQFVRSFPANDFLQQVHHLLDFKCVRIVSESSGKFSHDSIFRRILLLDMLQCFVGPI